MVPNLVNEAHKRLQTQGGRMTTQRRLILSCLAALDSHPTAEELYAVARQQDPHLNLSTVYRTLRWLEEEGLVSSRRFDESHRQERFDPMLPSQHHHFLCTNCKTVIEFGHSGFAAIQRDFENAYMAQVKSITVTLYGLCPDCITLTARTQENEHELPHLA